MGLSIARGGVSRLSILGVGGVGEPVLDIPGHHLRIAFVVTISCSGQLYYKKRSFSVSRSVEGINKLNDWPRKVVVPDGYA